MAFEEQRTSLGLLGCRITHHTAAAKASIRAVVAMAFVLISDFLVGGCGCFPLCVRVRLETLAARVVSRDAQCSAVLRVRTPRYKVLHRLTREHLKCVARPGRDHVQTSSPIKYNTIYFASIHKFGPKKPL